MLESGDPKNNERRWEFLGERPRIHRDENFMFVHGSARNPLNEYVFPEDIVYQQIKMERIYSLVDQYCFQGHTHIPGVFTDDNSFRSPEELHFEFTLDNRKALVNVGSVGQPRNGDCRSSYVILDGQKVSFKRVEYDLETTAQKIYDEPELDDYLGDRLRSGK
ncbi:MAG: metallophosphoesterase family protein [Planctomycetaceae bacterium]